MALSLNEIKTRAQQFVLNWKDKAATAREEAEGLLTGKRKRGKR